MKQYTKNNKIEASGFQETQKMSYKVCAKSFQIIISSIYKNKERVILSETGQNAFDAQRLAGRENLPFKIHLPCNMEPHYSIRDFGDSMDHDFMMNKYTRVFESTKDQDDDSDGSYGVGRLSVLSLTDSYTLSCFQNGKCRNYMVFMDGGEPHVGYVGEEDTTEENGTEIHAAIPRESINSFTQSARSVFDHYPVAPDFGENFTLDKKEELMSFKKSNLKVYKNSKVSIVMGLYSYPIEDFYIDELGSKYLCFARSGIVLKANLGDVDISVSRESLEYTQKSKDYIKNCLDQFIEDFREEITDELSEAKNIFQAGIVHYKLFIENGCPLWSFKNSSKEFKFEGEEWSFEGGYQFRPKMRTIKILNPDGISYREEPETESCFKKYARKWNRAGYSDFSFNCIGYKGYDANNTVWIYNDNKDKTSKGIQIACKYINSTSYNKAIYVYTSQCKADDIQFEKETGISVSEMKPLSECKDLRKKSTVRRKYSKVSRLRDSFLDPIEVDLDVDEFYYLEQIAGKILFQGREYMVKESGYFVSYLASMFPGSLDVIKDEKVIIVKRANKKKLGENKNCKPFEAKIKEIAQEYIKDIDYDELEQDKARTEIKGSPGFAVLSRYKYYDEFKLYKEYFDEVDKESYKEWNKYNRGFEMANVVGLDIKNLKTVPNRRLKRLGKSICVLTKRCPLITMIAVSSPTKEHAKSLRKYIKNTF
jgi:hypothetical protein